MIIHVDNGMSFSSLAPVNSYSAILPTRTYIHDSFFPVYADPVLLFTDSKNRSVLIIQDYRNSTKELLFSYSADLGVSWSEYERVISDSFNRTEIDFAVSVYASNDRFGNLVICFGNYNRSDTLAGSRHPLNICCCLI